jgi:hypothetical protein
MEGVGLWGRFGIVFGIGFEDGFGPATGRYLRPLRFDLSLSCLDFASA